MHNRLAIVCILVLIGLFISCGKDDDDPMAPQTPAGLLGPNVINIEQWSADQGGNDHFYGVIAIELYRNQVDTFLSSYRAAPWVAYLATITSEEENSFILEHILADTDEQSVLDAFWLDARWIGGVWYWSTEEPFSYVNWADGEPSHPGVETAMTMWGPTNTSSSRVPGTWNDAPPDSMVNPLAKFWAVVEFE